LVSFGLLLVSFGLVFCVWQATPREELSPVAEPFESTELDANREPLSKENSETFARRLSRRISESFAAQWPGDRSQQPSYYGRFTGQKKQSASFEDEGEDRRKTREGSNMPLLRLWSSVDCFRGC
jgi:hypothetical protein